jgi:prevent-host-death family protein
VRTAGVRELKSRLSEYLREVKHGETVLVTEHGEVVARLSPPDFERERPANEELRRLRKLIAQGKIRPPSAASAQRFPTRPAARLAKKDFERIWDDSRSDRSR